jgi:type I restriction enzyme S subunit
MLFKKHTLKEICYINKETYSKKEKWNFINYLDTKNIVENKINKIQNLNPKVDKIPSRAKRKVENNDIIISTVRPNQKHYGIINNKITNLLVSTGFTTLKVNENYALSEYVYYLITQNNVTEYLQSIAEQSTTSYPSIKSSDISNLKIDLPPLSFQKKVIKILSSIEKKIIINESINQNIYIKN